MISTLNSGVLGFSLAIGRGVRGVGHCARPGGADIVDRLGFINPGFGPGGFGCEYTVVKGRKSDCRGE